MNFLPAFALTVPLPLSLGYGRHIATQSLRQRQKIILAKTPTPPQEIPSCFGRGKQNPRSPLPLYALALNKIDPKSLLPPPSTRTETTFAVATALFTVPLIFLPTLAPTISFELPLSLLAASLLSVWALDNLLLQNAISRAASQQFSGQSRVAFHEAGHFLVAYLLGFPVEEYSLPSTSDVIFGERPGVTLGECTQAGDPFQVAAAGLAGMAGELVIMGDSEGGATDLGDVSRGIRACSREIVSRVWLEGVVRWGLVQAVLLLRQHEQAHRQLAEAMKERRSVEECVEVLERFVVRDALVSAQVVVL